MWKKGILAKIFDSLTSHDKNGFDLINKQEYGEGASTFACRENC